MNDEHKRKYPRVISYDGGKAEIRLMSANDGPDVLAFARELPPHDLLFLPRDISQPKVLTAWMSEIERGSFTSLIATAEGKVVGCAAIVRDPLSWSRHVGELRVVTSASVRGKGVGRALIEEAFALALGLGLEKLSAQMTIDQRGAIEIFEGLGFRGEALLRNQVRGSDGTKHDIVILSHDVAQVQAQMEAYGVTSAF
ncbi:MAG: GNAT family N-acetyltransferase [Beijerinckiaceae bacterium]